MVAYQLLERLQAGDASVETQRKFEQTKHDLGYGLLLKRYTDTITDANEAQIQQAADDSMPTVWPLFWSFRIMVGCGFIMLFVFGAALLQTCRQRITHKPWVLKAALWSIPLPWIAIERVGLSPNMVVSLGQSVKSFPSRLPSHPKRSKT